MEIQHILQVIKVDSVLGNTFIDSIIQTLFNTLYILFIIYWDILLLLLYIILYTWKAMPESKPYKLRF